MFRVAVCISGQSRTYKQCLGNQRRLFDNMYIGGKPIVVDYFFHTWDTNQWTNCGSDKAILHTIPYEPADIDVEFIQNNINLIDYKIETYDKNKINNHWGASLYSMHYSNYLKRKYELNNSFRYNLVIKSRFDILFDTDIRYNIAPLQDHIMYTASPMGRMDTELNYYNFDDVFFYGTSFTMDMLTDTYRYVNNNIDHHKFAINMENHDIPVEYFYGPGCLLYRYGTICGLSPCNSSPLYYIVARRAVMQKNLDGIINYNEIRQIHFDYYNNISRTQTDNDI